MTSPFWTYFHDRLRLGFIDAPGPLQALTQGLAHRLDTVQEDAVFLRAQWFAQLCEPEIVPAYGLSRGLARHHTETPEQFRQRVINAFAWHMLGGKQEGLPEILKFYGYSVAEIENLRKYQASRWAEFQVALVTPENPADQNDILRGLQTLVWLINEYKPARSVLFRMYTDIYDITPLVWSRGRWSDNFYTFFSGISASELGPDFAGNDGLILSFGLRYGFEAAAPDGDHGRPAFAGVSRQGFIVPYIAGPIWSFFRYGAGFPQRHGFGVGQVLGVDWAEAITRARAWEGGWDDNPWAEIVRWDRALPPWTMHGLGIARSRLVYGDPFLAGPDDEPQAGRWGGINAAWSLPTSTIVRRPPRWGKARWSEDVERVTRKILIQRRSRHAVSGAAPAYIGAYVSVKEEHL